MQMTRRFDLITFDLDGTMLDDEWAHRKQTAGWASALVSTTPSLVL